MSSTVTAASGADPAAWVAGRSWRMLCGGDLREAASGERYETVNPSNARALASVPAASGADVDLAVRAAAKAAADWRNVAPRQRAAVVRKIADRVLKHQDELGMLDALDGGNPITAMRQDVAHAAEMLNLYADWALLLGGETVPASAEHLSYTVREPYGVVARIVPYNHPIMFAAGRLAAPLVAGNAIVLKAPDQTPLSALRLGELIADLVPPGLVSILTGDGAVAGDALVRHPDVRRIAFIGSVSTGQAIQRAAAESGVKLVTLELGGKNACIVLPDADPQLAAAGAVAGMNFHSTGGQSCGSTSRLLVHASLYDEVVEQVVAEVDAVRVGLPLEPTTEMGSMVSDAQLQKVLRYIESGRDSGAELLAGGEPPDDPRLVDGYFVSPTVFGGVSPSMPIAQEEIFGPVLSVLRYETEDEAIAIANGTAFGLTASIWTRDVGRAHRMARQIDAGYVWINAVSRHFSGTSFGGVKDSGVGREEGLEELLSFTQCKTINVPLD